MNMNDTDQSDSLYYSIVDSEISNIKDDSTLKDDVNVSQTMIDTSKLEKTLRSGKKTLYEKSLLRSAVMSNSPRRKVILVQPDKNSIRSSTPNQLVKQELENDLNSPNKAPKMVTFKDKNHIVQPQIMITSTEGVNMVINSNEKEKTRIEIDENDEIVIENGGNWLDIKQKAASPRKLLLNNLVKEHKETLESILPPPLDGSTLSMTEIPESPITDYELVIPSSQIKAQPVSQLIFDISSGGEADNEFQSSFNNSPDFPTGINPEEMFEQQARAKLPDEVPISVTELDKKPQAKRVSMIPTKRETISSQYRNNTSKKATEPGEVRPPIRNWPVPAPTGAIREIQPKTGAIPKTTVNHRRTMLPSVSTNTRQTMVKPTSSSGESNGLTRRTMVQPTPLSGESNEKPKVTLKSRRSLHPAALRPTVSAPVKTLKVPVFKINKARRSSGIGISPAGRLSIERTKLGGGPAKISRKTMVTRILSASNSSNRAPRKSLGAVPKQNQVKQNQAKQSPKITRNPIQKPGTSTSTGAIPKPSQVQGKPIVSSNVCIYCDKKFAIPKALELHQLDKCIKIPPAAKKLLLTKQRACREEALSSRSYRSNVSTDISTSSSANYGDTSSFMPPPKSKGVVKPKEKLFARTPTKKLSCKPCNIKFANVIEFSNHVSETHMPKSCSETSEFDTD